MWQSIKRILKNHFQGKSQNWWMHLRKIRATDIRLLLLRWVTYIVVAVFGHLTLSYSYIILRSTCIVHMHTPSPINRTDFKGILCKFIIYIPYVLYQNTTISHKYFLCYCFLASLCKTSVCLHNKLIHSCNHTWVINCATQIKWIFSHVQWTPQWPSMLNTMNLSIKIKSGKLDKNIHDHALYG